MVVPAVTLHGALVHELLDRVRRAEPAHVERPQVEARVAVDDPVRNDPAGAAGRGDARREAAAQVEIVELRRQADHRLAVGGDRNRTVDHLPDADFVEDRYPRRRRFGQRREAVEVRLQQFGAEVPRDTSGAPRPRVGFPAAHRERTRFGLQVKAAVRVAQRRQSGGNALGLFGDEVLVLDGTHRHPGADHRRDFAAPHAGCIDHAFGVDFAGIGHDGRHPPPPRADRRHADTLDQGRVSPPRPRRIGIGKAGGIDVAVAFDPRRPDDAGRLEQRKQLARLPCRDEIDMKVEALGHRRGPLQFLPARRRRREPQASRAMPARRLPGFRLQRSVQLGAIAHQARQVAAAAQLPDQPGRMPRGAVRELQTFQQHDVAHAALGQMVGDAAADDPAADDDDAGLCGQIHGHVIPLQTE